MSRRRTLAPGTCAICGQTWAARYPEARYCSSRCTLRAWRGRHPDYWRRRRDPQIDARKAEREAARRERDATIRRRFDRGNGAPVWLIADDLGIPVSTVEQAIRGERPARFGRRLVGVSR
jgi:hypothetical protein